ncbi:MAG: c-type heme family protein [Burkholderiaceae bacterium]
MSLRLKFNLVLLLTFMIGIGISGYVSYDLLRKNARDEVFRSAGLMMEAALSMRAYTVGQVRPNLKVSDEEFIIQSVPSYSATEIMNALRVNHPDFAYKEAALNPTNLRDRAVDWESDIIQDFRNHTDRKEISGTRMTPTGLSLYVARPLQISQEACLACHSTASNAPPSMIKLYGPDNGFGWKHNEIIGAQIVSVPMSLPILNADRAFFTFMGSLAGVFVFLFIALNIMLSFMIIRPITRMSEAANRISTGDMSIPELPVNGKDEVSLLAKSFNRMRRSLEKAISLIDEK